MHRRSAPSGLPPPPRAPGVSGVLTSRAEGHHRVCPQAPPSWASARGLGVGVKNHPGDSDQAALAPPTPPQLIPVLVFKELLWSQRHQARRAVGTGKDNSHSRGRKARASGGVSTG